MKELIPTYKMAALLGWLHFIRCGRLAVLFGAGIYLLIWLGAKIVGKPFDRQIIFHYPHVSFAILFLIFAIPANLWVTRGLLQQRFKNFRITVIDGKEGDKT